MYFVYILECIGKRGKKTYYTGYTKSLERRFSEHSDGSGARYTKNKDLKLVFYQTFKTQKQAMQRELEIKKLSRQKKGELVKDIYINEKLHEVEE
ncbi:MAG: GIY-YIG nuclease family protein [Candidatus Hodarchaeota archaeon]